MELNEDDDDILWKGVNGSGGPDRGIGERLMKDTLTEDELVLATEQHWENSLREIDEMMEGVGIDFAKAYLASLNEDMTLLFGPPTDEEAQTFLEMLKEKVALDRMMIEFVQTVAKQKPEECREVVINSQMLGWVKGMHQRYPRLKMYSGARKMTGRKRTQPKLYGVLIVLDESVTEPRFW